MKTAKYISLFASLFLLAACNQHKWDTVAPVWYETITDSINLQLTYNGDTLPNTRDEVFVFSDSLNVTTDTLKGIYNRRPGTVYHWKEPLNKGYGAYTLMRLTDGVWQPINSGTVYHTP